MREVRNQKPETKYKDFHPSSMLVEPITVREQMIMFKFLHSKHFLMLLL